VTRFDTVLFYILFIFILLTMYYFNSLTFHDFYPFYYLLHFSLYDVGRYILLFYAVIMRYQI